MTLAEQNAAIVDIAVKNLADIEQFRGKVYQCSAGTDTIGYGFTDKDLVAKKTMTKAEADTILKDKCNKVLATVRRHITVPLTANQFAALVVFTYNVGDSGFRTSTLLKQINGRAANSTICAEFKKWIYARKVSNGRIVKEMSSGLINRRTKEIALWNKK